MRFMQKSHSQPLFTQQMASSKKQKKLCLYTLSATLLLGVAIVSVVACLSSQKHPKKINDRAAHALVKATCSNTLYQDLCYSTIAEVPYAASMIKTPKDVIDFTVNRTIVSVHHNYFTVMKQMAPRRTRTSQQNTALHDCLQTIDETLEELHSAQLYLHEYPSFKKSIAEHADDLMALLSAAMTNQETCLEGFTYNKSDRKISNPLTPGQTYVFKMCSNALAMIKNLTSIDMARQGYSLERKLKEGSRKGSPKWVSPGDRRFLSQKGLPKWLSPGDRRLLFEPIVEPNVTVAADGSGNYTSISAAVLAAPEKSNTRYIIKIKAGVYRENVEVPKKKTNLMFVGEGRSKTVITGSRNVVDGSTTFHSATVAVVGGRFLARDITFENTAGPSKHQAVALRVNSDFSAFYNCEMLAYQDTLYVHSLRQFYVNCLITGTVDFIFGNAEVVFQDCDIQARRPNSGQKNMITAQGRDDPNQNTGIVIQKCRIGATADLEPVKNDFPTFLGRPWKRYSRTIVMQSTISDVVRPEGWHVWHGDFALDTLFYAEYQNIGPGADTSKRVTWEGFKVFTNASEAEPFTVERFISGSHWLNSTGFPFSLHL